MTALFIPLRTKWFCLHETGAKMTEYRAYGPRWNETTCKVGRMVTLSHGYSGRRLPRRVAGFDRMAFADAPTEAQLIYPNAKFIAAIHLEIVP